MQFSKIKLVVILAVAAYDVSASTSAEAAEHNIPRGVGALGAKCTQSKQCKSQYCDRGTCAKTVAAGAKCSKDIGCAEHKDGAICLSKATSFVVYNKADEKQTKTVSAGRCSYVHRLGLNMKCASDTNCYGAKFQCSASSKKCIVKDGSLLYKESCSTDASCVSSRCTDGRCACKRASNDCGPTKTCDGRTRKCIKRSGFCDLENPGTCTLYHCISSCGDECQASCACNTDADCGQDSSCQNDMYAGLICKTKAGSLVYQQTCQDDTACDSGQCIGGKCGCKLGSSDCNSSEVCDNNTRQCIPRSGFCHIDNPGTCATYHCVSSCGSDCQASCACTTNQDCGADSTCQTTSSGMICDLPPDMS